MMWANMHSKDSIFFLWGWLMRGFELLLFLMCSHQVLIEFSMCSPICYQQHLTLSHILCPKFFYSCNLYRQPKDNNISLLQLFKAFFFFGGGGAMRPINDVHHKRKIIELWRFPQLINMRIFHSEHTFLSWYPNKYYPGIMIIIILSSVLYLG
jgi:hypothetical protein